MEQPPVNEEMDAYALLSRPTLELTDAQVEAIVVDLRKRRELYIKTGKPDRPSKPKALEGPKAKLTAADKAANTALLLERLNLKV